MTDFWETKFAEEQTMWGFEPSDSAIICKDLFLENNIQNILIPGIGYGRNAKIFHDNGFKVSGIELSKTAIDLAKSKNGLDITIYHGSVTEMPFDNNKYDAIFCYALLHLLNRNERKKFLNDCYKQIKPGGFMVFTVVSKKANMYGIGKQLSKDRFEIFRGVSVFFYDSQAVEKEFKDFGLLDYVEIDEPIKHMENEEPLKCIYVKCRKWSD